MKQCWGCFWKREDIRYPNSRKSKSASALSRFLNIYDWSTRSVIRTTRARIIKEILSECPKGRKPFLQVIIDLTTLEKFGKFKDFNNLITVYNGKRGLHLVVVYLVVGQWRVPWSFRVWRGKGTASPARLGLKQVLCLPQALTKHFKVMILADTAFGSIEFLHGIRKLKYHAIVGVRVDRKLVDGRVLRHLHKPGQQVQFVGLKFAVTVSWYYLKRDNGKLEKRFVLSTKPLKASTINWWGKRRWQIEGWFKTAKHRFGLHRFGQGTRVGVYRWLVMSANCLSFGSEGLIYRSPLQIHLTGAKLRKLQFIACLPQLLMCLILLYFERMRFFTLSHGIDINISRCKI